MRIGRLEIKWILDQPKSAPAATDGVDRSGVFAVPATENWWLAVHQVLNEAEKETITGARNRVTNTNMCISAVGAGEGIDLVRSKLIDARNAALSVAKARGELKQYAV